MELKQSSEGEEAPANTYRKSGPGRGNSQHKGSEASLHLAYSQSSKELEGSRRDGGKRGGDGGQGVQAHCKDSSCSAVQGAKLQWPQWPRIDM